MYNGPVVSGNNYFAVNKYDFCCSAPPLCVLERERAGGEIPFRAEHSTVSFLHNGQLQY